MNKCGSHFIFLDVFHQNYQKYWDLYLKVHFKPLFVLLRRSTFQLLDRKSVSNGSYSIYIYL